MRILTDNEVAQTILEQGPLTTEELARMAYPVRVAYLALMLSWAKEHGLDNLVDQREVLKPMVLRGLEETVASMDSFWKDHVDRPPKAKSAEASKESKQKGSKKKGGKR